MTQSYSKIADSLLISEDADFYRLDGELVRESQEHKVVLKFKKRSKKSVERDGRSLDRLADHIGYMPIVMVTPDDIDIITGGNAIRRMLIDRTISQVDPAYLDHSMKYGRLLKQRNALLKQFQERQSYDETLLIAYDERMKAHVEYIYDARFDFIKTFSKSIGHRYKELSAGDESVDLHYEPSSNSESFLADLSDQRKADCAIGRTIKGPHADKLIFQMGGHDMKIYASQGQKKSAIFATKLAQYHYLHTSTGLKPILILDDVFDRLDSKRAERLLSLVLGEHYGQIFLSDTEADRMISLPTMANLKMQMIEIKGT